MKNLFSYLLLISLFSTKNYSQPCFPNQVVTASYATGGDSPYKKDIVWLTWGSTLANVSQFPYGNHGQPIKIGDKSRASLHLEGNNYMCIEVEITEINRPNFNLSLAQKNNLIASYKPGTYTGDSMDKLYNIGGIGANNKLIAGIVNRLEKYEIEVTFSAKATLNNNPIRLTGLAFADAESLAPTNEHLKAEAIGNWNIIDIRKNTASNQYLISKKMITHNLQQIFFSKGNNTNTGGVAILEFTKDAYAANDFSVSFKVNLKGSGKTALAVGVLTPLSDLGDAPQSYGSPMHLIQNLKIKSDGIPVTNTSVNINTKEYNPGGLELTDGKYLGSSPPDHDNVTYDSDDAMGDNITGSAGIKEEDAWPENFIRISNNQIRAWNNQIIVNIPFKNGEINDYISGWIDFNLNGVFDESERQTKQLTYQDINNGFVTLSWTIPSSVKPKTTYTRLRYFSKNETYTSPTAPANFGEVEDHKIFFVYPQNTNPALLNQHKG
ncbi:CshA/CshB family fibrillar adhesin-related protein [Capnocytophaga sp. ARDL2]|uniref:CshA/CshB family fibrillar adhesin-related protein n=1 Tax=Capnocytophaga sp. ARDL2 TaxID=3238809 RepID=UPI0035584DB1